MSSEELGDAAGATALLDRELPDELATGAGDDGSDVAFDERWSGDQLATCALVVAAMAVVATSGFRTVMSSATFLAASVVGAALGALVVVVGRRQKLLLGEIVGIGILAPMIIGPLAVGGLGFYEGVVFGWAEILSATPPIDPTPALKALPFLAAFVGALLGTELVRVRELPGIAILGPIVTLVLTALFSEQTRTGALAVGLVLLVGLLIIARLHHAVVTQTGLLVLGLVLGLVAAFASGASLLLPYADESMRFDLRELQTSPWDPLAIASPLTEVKAGLKTATDDQQPVLRIRGDTPVDRWRTASLPAFNGVFWSVADPGTVAEFVSIDRSLPEIEGEPGTTRELTFDVDIVEPMGHWLPTAGVPTRIDFRDDTDARISLETGTVGIPEQLQPGNSYELTVTEWAVLDDTSLQDTVFAADQRSAELELLPPLVRNLAADFSTGIDQLSGRRVIAIRDNLRLGSYDLNEAPGHSFGRIAEFLQSVQLTNGARIEEDLRTMAGYEELYAATGAVLTRLSDIPSRVAVGYLIPDDRWSDRSAEVYASDANAWVEVFIDGTGWVPIDVTPDRARAPDEVDEGTETEGVPVADPPKSPPNGEEEDEAEIDEPEDEPEADDETDDADDESGDAGLSLGRVAATAAVTSFLLAGVGIGLIVGLKLLRRRRRRRTDVPAARIAGAWSELVDRVGEAGGQLPARATPHEAALYSQNIEVLAAPEISDRVERLAGQVSAAAFHPVPPTVETAEEAWQTYDELAATLNQAAGVGERVKRAVDPRPLRDDGLVRAR